jgi:hypothetical protein
VTVRGNVVEITAPPLVAGQLPPVKLTMDGDEIVVEGLVPDTGGASPLTDALKVVVMTDAGWLAFKTFLSAHTPTMLPEVTAQTALNTAVTAGQIRLAGKLRSA